jgi:carbon monoxide dehydrogenase subunit G
MAARIESAVMIARPVEEVFAFLTDLERSAKVDPTVESVEKTSEGPIGVGTTFRLRQHALGRSSDATVAFTGLERNRRVDFESRVGPLRPRMSMTFEEVEGGTRVTVTGEPNPAGIFKLLSGRFRRIGQRIWDERLERQKAALEGTG